MKLFENAPAIVLLAIATNPANAQNLRDIEICENVKNITARDAGKALDKGCAGIGVNIGEERSRRWVFDRLEPRHLPTKLECLSSCAVLDAFDDMKMSDCVVEVHVKPFTEGMTNNIVFNAQTCKAIKQEASN